MLQLPLDVELKVDATFDNFMLGQNSILINSLKSIVPNTEEFLYFYGPTGSGKTHLLQAIVHQANEFEEFNLAYLPLKSDALSPEFLSGFETFDCVCLDDIDVILQGELSSEWQESIFHLYNQLRDSGKSLIITGQEAPAALKLDLQDLKSRLTAMYIHEIKSLSDDEKAHYIQSKAEEKGLSISKDIAAFLLARSKRDLDSLNQSIDKLDAASLQAQRKITKPFVKEVLGL